MQLTYSSDVFKVNDIAQAMRIILTDEGTSTEERWKNETPYVAELIGKSLAVETDTIVLDYGCGIGRMAKQLIAQYGCRVIGVDISANMRALAVTYVQSDRFLACPPLMLDTIIESGLRFDAAISIWVLRHCHQPTNEVARLHKSLKADGRLFVLNNDGRAVPTVEKGWIDDGIDIKATLARQFELERDGRMPREKFSSIIADFTFWASYRPRPFA